ncbi:bifunctional molybdenum cofactor biosynthesis protein MoaC/MoaB [Persicimonas caeni]|uniref:Bifunctional molybdenum cofactor biosynthesis protein MoaC/MoaB n=1 Tax=Persicimonas caeni TaxID=2292766 RepID=A0A4Y6PPE0_PERCE|nr:molybdopterin-binding protein [Persicimonas caeni]QDG50178.1 bifunctional molybdenum cofactor biosynthesis protein MoaC/MoaB [Persicimonas caeni]QED31399.1 bifunctional molybdenum cofactor biosynthesis protein MoaC/MoaB [Persicimonas caeni]
MPNSPKHHHTARAEAKLRFGAGVRDELDNSPVLQTARVAGVMAARRAADLLPYADHVEVTGVFITFEWEDDGLRLVARCEGFSRAQLGSRALLAAQICAVTIVDSLPDHALDIELGEARIVAQKGGLEGLSYSFDPPVEASIVVISDAVASGQKDDRAGSVVRSAVEDLTPHGVRLVGYEVIGDDAEAIEAKIRQLVAGRSELVLTVGGTGLAHTDVTVETVEALIERPVPGLMEAARSYGQELTPVAFMSRGVAGIVDDTLVVTLPGSRGGARESAEALFPAILHVFKTLRKSRELLGE